MPFVETLLLIILFLPSSNYHVAYLIYISFLLLSLSFLRLRINSYFLFISFSVPTFLAIFQALLYGGVISSSLIRLFLLLLIFVFLESYPRTGNINLSLLSFSAYFLSVSNFIISLMQFLKIPPIYSDFFNSIFVDSGHAENLSRLIVRSTSIYPNHSVLSIISALSLNFFLYLKLFPCSTRPSWVFLPLGILPLLLSQSITSFVALILAFFLAYLTISFKFLSFLKIRIRALVASSLFFVSFAIILFLPVLSSFYRRFELILQGDLGSSFTARTDNWNIIIDQERGLFSELIGLDPNIYSSFPSFDNDYLLFYTTTGLLGLLVFFSSVIYLLNLNAQILKSVSRLAASFYFLANLIFIAFSSFSLPVLSQPSVLFFLFFQSLYLRVLHQHSMHTCIAEA